MWTNLTYISYCKSINGWQVMALLIFYVLLALVLSFLCSVMEAVLLSITPAYIAQQEQENPKQGKQLNKLKQDIESPLASILSLNTIAHTVGAAGAGAQAAHVFGDQYVGIISAVLTLLILIFSEIIPKTLGAVYWKQLTEFVVISLKITNIAMIPFVKLSNVITNVITSNKIEEKIDKDEFRALMEKAVNEGMFNLHESNILLNLFLFRKLPVSNIMTPQNSSFLLWMKRPMLRLSSMRTPIFHSHVSQYIKTIQTISPVLCLRVTSFWRLSQKSMTVH